VPIYVQPDTDAAVARQYQHGFGGIPVVLNNGVISTTLKYTVLAAYLSTPDGLLDHADSPDEEQCFHVPRAEAGDPMVFVALEGG
jgi:hypothetical protein